MLIMLKMKRQPYEKIKTFARDYYGGIKKCRVILSHAFGQLFWKQLSDKQFETMFEKAITRIEGIHTREDLDLKMAEIIDTDEIDMFSELPFKWYVIDDFSETHSQAAIMFNHAWMDGVSFLSKFYLLRNKPDNKKAIKQAAAPSLIQRMMLSATIPYYFVKILAEIALMKFQTNVGGGFTVELPKGEKTVCHTLEFPRKLFEQRCKEYKSSMTIMTHSIYG